MRINIFTLRFALLLIVFRLVVEVAVGMTVAKYFYPIELGINIQKGLNILLLLIEAYLLYYFLFFLNQILVFRKLNFFVWILILSSFLQIIFYHIMKLEVTGKGTGVYLLAAFGLSHLFARIGLFIRQFKYRGPFRLELSLYGFALIVPLIFQTGLVLMILIFKNMDANWVPTISMFLLFLPSTVLFFMFYKALKKSNFQEEKSSSSALDGGEFSH